MLILLAEDLQDILFLLVILFTYHICLVCRSERIFGQLYVFSLQDYGKMVTAFVCRETC